MKLFYPFFIFKQKIKLKILRFKDKKSDIAKYIKEHINNIRNDERYDPTVLYLKLFGSTSVIMSMVVFGYKHNEYSLLLGTSIAATIALAQYYIEWGYKLNKKYRRK